ncbi:hypothetical protein [Halodurantibacterium flavum]|uniref:PEP-CTERM sorting domain-containing protein n=1 Tax=Halodurantibacterium flavum TaxID=1382802 RepID=A0ABW4S9Q6_9RHOB
MPPARFAILLAGVIGAAGLTILAASLIVPGSAVEPALPLALLLAAAGAFVAGRRWK